MAEYGFFDLSDTLINKLDTNNFTASYIKDIKNIIIRLQWLVRKI